MRSDHFGLEFDRMHSSDIDSVMWIERASFSSPWSKDSFQECLTHENMHCLVLRHREKVVAYVVFTIKSDKSHIGNFAVHPDYRNKGIGTELLGRTLSYIRSHVKKVTLEVRVGNIAARNLYRKFGFKVVGFRKNYYSDNNEAALVMAIVWQKSIGLRTESMSYYLNRKE